MSCIKAILDQDLVHDLIRCLTKAKYINDPWSLTITMDSNSNQPGYISRASLHYINYNLQLMISSLAIGTVAGDIETVLSVLTRYQIVALELSKYSERPSSNSIFTIVPLDSKEVNIIPIYTHSAYNDKVLEAQKVITEVLGTQQIISKVLEAQRIITEVKELIDEVPTINDDNLGIIRHGASGRWYIRNDHQPLIYQYWLFDKEVSKADYDKYTSLCRQEVQSQNILIPELCHLIGIYIS